MKMWMKTVLCISLSLMCLFVGIGYCAMSGFLNISGEIQVLPREPEGLHISSIELYTQSGVVTPEFNRVLPTNLQSTVYINTPGASITYKITVNNKTDVTYWYLGTEALEGVADNDLINSSGGVFITTKDHYENNSSYFDQSDWIPPQTERVFYATYTFGGNAMGSVSTLVNFSFGMNMGSVSDGFLKVLNDKVSPYGYYYLADAFNQNYSQNGSTVIGNIGDDEEIFNNLFGADLSVNVDGVDMPVTIMVERKNVDGKANSGDSYNGNNAPSGCEYTIYVTVDDLSSPNGKATVHAVSYTCGADGIWYQIGELYEGESSIVDYDSSDGVYEGAFDVDNWIATQNEYAVTDDISYKVGYEQGTQYDKINTIEELMSVNDQEFYNKVNNNSGKLLKPVCNILYSYTHNNGQYTETENASNRYKQGYAALKSAFDKIKPYCLIANGAQEVKVQNASSLSRAELIQMIEEIQHAYDYYLAVNLND